MNIKKLTQKDRYGNMISYEFDIPPMENIPHPGGPRGTDTVPAWLTPGERVMNAEAERIYGPQLEAMNEHGRALQRAQGGTIPEYAACGKKVHYAAEGDFVSFEDLPGFSLIKDQEGYNPNVYADDSVIQGAQSVGYGHRLLPNEKTSGYTSQELEDLYMKDFLMAQQAARENIPGFDQMPDELKGAFTSQAYQLGAQGQADFEDMIAALNEGDRAKAMAEVQNSDWAKQTPQRSNYLYNALAMNDLVSVPKPDYLGDEVQEGIANVTGEDIRTKPDIEVKVPEPKPEPRVKPEEVKTPTTKEEFDTFTWDDVKNDPDWQVVSVGKEADPSLLSKAFDFLKEEIMDSGLIDTRQLTRAAMLYTGSRLLGYDHVGSGQYAVKSYLSGISAKDAHINKLIESGKADPASIKKYRRSGDPSDIKAKTTLNLGSDIKVGLAKTKDGSVMEVPVQYDENSNRWGYLNNNGNFIPVNPGSVRNRVEPRTPQQISESWQKIQNEWEQNIGSTFNGLLNSQAKEALQSKGIRVLDSGTLARQAESAFRDMGYDPDDPTVVREMPTIIDQALVAYNRELRTKKYSDLSFEPFIRQEIVKGKLSGNKEAAELFVINPLETDLSKRQYSSTRQVMLTLDSMDLIAQESLSSSDKYKDKEIPKEAIEAKRNTWIRQAARYFNSPKGKALREKYTGNEDLGQSGFMEYLIDIMTNDNKITPEEIGLKK